jgi:hypothetical protein
VHHFGGRAPRQFFQFFERFLGGDVGCLRNLAAGLQLQPDQDRLLPLISVLPAVRPLGLLRNG